MSDLGWMLLGNLAPAAMGYLVVCWKDACSATVPAGDDLGLCPDHRDELRDDDAREPRA